MQATVDHVQATHLVDKDSNGRGAWPTSVSWRSPDFAACAQARAGGSRGGAITFGTQAPMSMMWGGGAMIPLTVLMNSSRCDRRPPARHIVDRGLIVCGASLSTSVRLDEDVALNR